MWTWLSKCLTTWRKKFKKLMIWDWEVLIESKIYNWFHFGVKSSQKIKILLKKQIQSYFFLLILYHMTWDPHKAEAPWGYRPQGLGSSPCLETSPCLESLWLGSTCAKDPWTGTPWLVWCLEWRLKVVFRQFFLLIITWTQPMPNWAALKSTAQ